MGNDAEATSERQSEELADHEVDTITLAVDSGLKLMDQFGTWVPKEAQETVELPVVDLEQLRKASEAGEQQLAECLKELKEVTQEWGFFRVSNHGVKAELLQKLEEQMLRWSLLPIEMKRMAPLPPKHEIGFFSGADAHIGLKYLLWSEALQVYCDPVCVDEHTRKFWPNGDGEEFSSTIKAYMRASQHLALEVLHYLASALNLDSSKLTPHCSGTNSCLRINHYPVCKKSRAPLGLGAHADEDALTIVYEDQVGGLQVLKDNKWFSIKPQPNTLVVNVGDILQMRSNDLYKSVVHRVAVNSEKRRISAALFLYPQPDSLIEPAAELIEELRPSKYKPVLFDDYRVWSYKGEVMEKPKSWISEMKACESN